MELLQKSGSTETRLLVSGLPYLKKTRHDVEVPQRTHLVLLERFQQLGHALD